jgi:hypothetical protein
MDKFSKVAAGVPSSAAPTTSAGWINSVSEAAEWYEKNIRLGQYSPTGAALDPLVQVQNKTGADLARGSVVQLGASLLDEVDRDSLWFEGDVYSDGVVAILIDPVADDEIGDAKTVGTAVALVNVTSTGHKFAAPTAGETVLQSATEGPVQILGTIVETGEQECAVLIGDGSGVLTVRRGRVSTATVATFTHNGDVEVGGELEVWEVIPVASVADYDTAGSYVPGNFAREAGALYRCNTATGDPAGAFDAGDWDAITPETDLRLIDRTQPTVTVKHSFHEQAPEGALVEWDSQGIRILTCDAPADWS